MYNIFLKQSLLYRSVALDSTITIIATGTMFTKLNALVSEQGHVVGVHALDPSCASPTSGKSLYSANPLKHHATDRQ